MLKSLYRLKFGYYSQRLLRLFALVFDLQRGLAQGSFCVYSNARCAGDE